MGRITTYIKTTIYLTIAVILISCSDNDSKDVPKNELPKKEVTYVKAPDFNADSAYTYVQKQVDFGYRVPNTTAHLACGDWLVSELQRYGAEVTEQSFRKKAYDLKVLNLRNIIGTFNPQAKKRILLAAHWDTRHIADNDTINDEKPFDGANDGASGVGILLEIARQVSMQSPDAGVDIILFDGEDYGQPNDDDKYPQMQNSWCFGSQYWAENKHKPNYNAHFGILLDMVGAKNARFAKDGVSQYFAPSVVNKVWNTAQRVGYGNYFWNHQSPQITDDHLYVNELAKIPMIDIVEYNATSPIGSYFGDYHHTHRDNMELIDKNTLKAVGQTVLEVIYNE